MYKSPAAQTFKDLMSQLKDVRANRSMAIEPAASDDAMELGTREASLEAQIGKNCAPVSTVPTARWSPPTILPNWSPLWTGVPLMQLATEESERLLHMEDELRKFIVRAG